MLMLDLIFLNLLYQLILDNSKYQKEYQEKQIYPATSGRPPKDDAILGEAPEQPMSKPQPVIVRPVGKSPN